MIMHLSGRDKKLLMEEMRFGITVALLFLGIGLFIGLTCYVFSTVIALWMLIVFYILIILASFAIYGMFNRKRTIDLFRDRKRRVIVTVQDKWDSASAEAGSGKPFPYILGMNRYNVYWLVVENVYYKVDKDIYDLFETGGKAEMHYTDYGNNFLGFYPHHE